MGQKNEIRRGNERRGVGRGVKPLVFSVLLFYDLVKQG